MKANNELIVDIYNNFIKERKIEKSSNSEFKTYVSKLIQNNLSDFFSVNDNQDWKTEQKRKFSGRGMQWIYISLEDINPALEKYEKLGKDLTEYKENINRIGKAWVRYSGPKKHPETGLPCASFEIRYQGSKVPQSDTVFFIDNDKCMSTVETLRLEDNKTPHQLGLEESQKKNVVKSVKIKEGNVKVKQTSKTKDLDIDVETLSINNSVPVTNNPEEWEMFLKSEGLSYMSEN